MTTAPLFDFSTQLEKKYFGSVAAIGNFDAVHRGHQALLEAGRKRALQLGVPFSVLTFEPHPRTFFAKGGVQNFRVTPDQIKYEMLSHFGADVIFSLPFTFEISQLSADQFITSILKDTLKLNSIVCGYDFHFGHNRTGHANDLQRANLDVIQLGALQDASQQTYSASRIRDFISAGQIQEANDLLGWNWFLRGMVKHGDKRGRTIGFPTLNTPIGESIAPRYGIYASMVRHKGRLYPSISNIGIRPMFELKTPIAETYIFDFDQDMYGEEVDIIPIQHIRDEMKLSSLDELKNQIQRDCDVALSILSTTGGIK